MNPEVVNLAKKNVHVLGKEIEIGFYQEDLFSNNTHKEKNPVVIMNPPYGIRVGENINLDFYLKIIRTVEEKFHPQILGIIIPADYKINSTKEWSVVSARAFKNGGIEVVFYTILYLR
jgi:23S rRNA G2445 N2-methylase RlmL